MARRPGRTMGWVLGTAAWLGLLGAACSTEVRLDRAGLEAEVRAQLFPEHAALTSDVNCPELRDPAVGRSFVCAAQIGDQIIDVPVELAGEPGELRARVTLDERFVAAAEVADLLAQTFSEEIAVETTVDCGQAIVVLEPGAPLRCRATDSTGAVRHFDVAIDTSGQLAISIR